MISDVSRSFSLVASALLLSAGAQAASAKDAVTATAIDFAAISAISDPSVASPQVASINYERLYRRLVQAGMLSQVLEYRLAVDAEGRPTGCSFTRSFRMLVTEREVCRSLMRSISFTPARDAQGNPVASTFQGKVEIASFFQPDR